MTAAVSEPASKPTAAIPSRPQRKGAPVSNQVGAIPVVEALPVSQSAVTVAPAPPAIMLQQDAMQALLSTLTAIGQSMQTLNARVDQVSSPAQAAAVPNSVQMDLLRRAVDTQRPNGYAFQLVVIPEDDFPSVEQYITIEEMIARIKSLIGKNVYLFPGVGQTYTITKGRLRYLQTPLGSFPLFDMDAPQSPVASLTGWMGDPMTEEELETEAANALAEQEAEEEPESPGPPAAPAS
jgi:hypothetical protein